MRVVFFLLLALLLALRIYFYERQKNFPDNTKVRISGRVRREPVKSKNFQYINFGGFDVFLPKELEVNYSDELVIEGKVSGKRLEEVKVLSIEPRGGFLKNFRQRVSSFYLESLPQPHASLIEGMILGSRLNMPYDFWQKLKTTGTAHVVVASGMNVTLLATFLIAILSVFFSRKIAIPFAVLGIWSYASLVGFDAPIIRAATMSSITFISQELGRLSLSLKVLLVTSAIMIFLNPAWIWDIGFQLSFLATLSLILFEKKVRDFFNFLPNFFRESFSTSLTAQIGVSAVLYFTFGNFNLFSPLINSAVLWTVVPITIIGMVSALVNFFSFALARLLVLLSYPLASWFIFVVKSLG